MTGIYKITSPTNKVYIGQSYKLEKRRGQYSRLDCVTQTKIYNSLKKHGWEAHTFEVIMPLRDDILPEIITYWEQFFMDYYRAEGYDMLNSALYASTSPMKGRKHKQETKDRWSTIRTGRTLSEELKEKLRKINIGRPPTTLGKKHSTESLQKIKEWNKNDPNKQYRYDKIRGSKNVWSKAVLQYSLSGELIEEFVCISDAYKRLGKLNNGDISRACKGIRKDCYGYIWKYKVIE